MKGIQPWIIASGSYLLVLSLVAGSARGDDDFDNRVADLQNHRGISKTADTIEDRVKSTANAASKAAQAATDVAKGAKDRLDKLMGWNQPGDIFDCDNPDEVYERPRDDGPHSGAAWHEHCDSQNAKKDAERQQRRMQDEFEKERKAGALTAPGFDNCEQAHETHDLEALAKCRDELNAAQAQVDATKAKIRAQAQAAAQALAAQQRANEEAAAQADSPKSDGLFETLMGFVAPRLLKRRVPAAGGGQKDCSAYSKLSSPGAISPYTACMVSP
ncbi:MAG: hypothetical protein JO006_06600 [Paucibacter sp.]|nr:hypothetical protein [Roseateles sp.]